jgi:hypothetical protein
MVGLKISPLRGLFTIWLVLCYNFIIPSGLKVVKPLIHLKIEAMCRFGLEFLSDGYLKKFVENSDKLLNTNDSLFDGHLIKHIL